MGTATSTARAIRGTQEDVKPVLPDLEQTKRTLDDIASIIMWYDVFIASDQHKRDDIEEATRNRAELVTLQTLYVERLVKLMHHDCQMLRKRVADDQDKAKDDPPPKRQMLRFQHEQANERNDTDNPY
ncbi:hypothetical protein CONLIGDRAFT_647186 [Coniochaeta ligniaria NRRL 30616]|uniref:Uncharacterized protein n=1 Tax=Coniochaeta ligniaria NRRL 30616 TaxID=1408157 RepID=A0A1J7IIH8_9PEZI|nr:hypothetical protein CONLIGDRAFT_647186 [Coniochaeta ligniaria NRRL 30616]